MERDWRSVVTILSSRASMSGTGRAALNGHIGAPSPTLFGLPADRFPSWRPGQYDALCWALEQDERHVGAGLPTGVGKSGLAIALARMTGQRAVVLTSRKGLADQYTASFPDIAEIRGRRNRDVYPTTQHYRDAVDKARAAQIVVTNYAYWMASRHSNSLGNRSLVVLDEAHEAFDELSNHLTIEFTKEEMRSWKIDWPDECDEDTGQWAQWARDVGIPRFERIRKPEENTALYDLWEGLKQRLESAAGILDDDPEQWIGQREDTESARYRGPWVRLTKIWPADNAEHILFRGAERVLWLSATLRPKTFDLLGVKQAAFQEWPHPFPQQYRPVYWLYGTGRMTPEPKADIAQYAWRNWQQTIDRLIARGMDRLGVVHTVSYRRARDYMAASQYGWMLSTHSSENTAQAVNEFLLREPPGVLVSPVLVAGWDMGAVGWQVIGKLPYPAPDPVSTARKKRDPEVIEYKVAQDIVQTSGRNVRGPTRPDAGETWVVDDAIGWFSAKARQKGWWPAWFGVQKVMSIPDRRVWD